MLDEPVSNVGPADEPRGSDAAQDAQQQPPAQDVPQPAPAKQPRPQNAGQIITTLQQRLTSAEKLIEQIKQTVEPFSYWWNASFEEGQACLTVKKLIEDSKL